VLGGSAREFSLEYACHAPDEHRWFRVVVVPVLDPRLGAAIVSHVNVTERQATQAALRTSEAKLRTIFENEPECVKTLSLDGRLLDMNPAGLRLLEADSLADVMGQRVELLVHPDDRQAFREFHARTCDGVVGELQFRVRGLKGTERWLEMHAVPIRDAAGDITTALSITRDITARRSAEQAMRESEERFQWLAKATNDVMWDWDLVADKLVWNEAVEGMVGVRPYVLEPTVEAWRSHIHHKDRERVMRSVTEAQNGTASTWSAEYQIVRKDGSRAFVLDRGYIIRDSSGRAVRMIGGVTDLTERHANEAKLAEQAALLDAAQDAIFVRDMDHRIT